MRSNKEIQELINLYIFGALDAAEKSEVEEYLKEPEYLKYFNETRFLLDQSAFSYEEEAEVPSDIKSKIMAEIEGTQIPDSSSDNVIRPNFLSRYGFALAASLAGILLIYTFTLSQQLNEQKAQIAKLQAGYEENHHFVDFVNNPNVFQVKLAADDNSNALGNLAWDKESNDAMLYVSNLMEPPGKDVYQVWVVHKDNSVAEAMGTFRVNEDGTYMLTIGCMPKPSETKAIFITMEPDGGMPEPTGTTYLRGFL